MRGIVKQFPGVLANDHVHFSVRAGEIHALVGENGAGKSSLMNILYGLIKPGSGEIPIYCKPVRIPVPRDAPRAGRVRGSGGGFAVRPAVRTVGGMGDGRTYQYPIIIRAVTSEDAMTADWARLPADVLERMASRIINEVPGVNRVAYDITSKPPGTIEWE